MRIFALLIYKINKTKFCHNYQAINKGGFMYFMLEKLFCLLIKTIKSFFFQTLFLYKNNKFEFAEIELKVQL